jgi:hypothetical protein
MVHVKWFIALVAVTAVSIYASIFFTEKYVNETVIGELSEITILNNKAYESMVQAIDEKKYPDARAKLVKMKQMEIDQIKDFKSRLEGGYFRYLNNEAIERMNRYLTSTDSKAPSGTR